MLVAEYIRTQRQLMTCAVRYQREYPMALLVSSRDRGRHHAAHQLHAMRSVRGGGRALTEDLRTLLDLVGDGEHLDLLGATPEFMRARFPDVNTALAGRNTVTTHPQLFGQASNVTDGPIDTVLAELETRQGMAGPWVFDSLPSGFANVLVMSRPWCARNVGQLVSSPEGRVFQHEWHLLECDSVSDFRLRLNTFRGGGRGTGCVWFRERASSPTAPTNPWLEWTRRMLFGSTTAMLSSPEHEQHALYSEERSCGVFLHGSRESLVEFVRRDLLPTGVTATVCVVCHNRIGALCVCGHSSQSHVGGVELLENGDLRALQGSRCVGCTTCPSFMGTALVLTENVRRAIYPNQETAHVCTAHCLTRVEESYRTHLRAERRAQRRRDQAAANEASAAALRTEQA